jgi:hypothetical protein
MKRLILLPLIIIISVITIHAQTCEAYIPTKKGINYTYKTTNGKGKIQSYYSQELINSYSEDGGTKFEISQKNYNEKKELIGEDTLEFYCKDNMFYIDMSSYLSKEQMGAYEGAEIEISFDNIGYPQNIEVGTQLKDGYVQAEINMGMVLTFRTDITNRKVLAKETITTEAGSFKTVKVSEDISSKLGFVKVNMSSINWASANIGNIRSETYDKNGKLLSVTELESIK